MNEIITAQRDVYRDNFLRNGDTPEATFNTSTTLQDLRFAKLIEHLELGRQAFELHDVGCGICDLWGYLVKRGISACYSGTEIVPEMKELADSKYSDIVVSLRDFTNDVPDDEKHDFVVLAGVFNMPGQLGTLKWQKFTEDVILAMYKVARRGIAFNFLTKDADFYHPKLFYLDPSTVRDFCVRNLSRHVIIDQSYPLFECTVTVLKPEEVRSRFDSPAFQKYYSKI